MRVLAITACNFSSMSLSVGSCRKEKGGLSVWQHLEWLFQIQVDASRCDLVRFIMPHEQRAMQGLLPLLLFPIRVHTSCLSALSSGGCEVRTSILSVTAYLWDLSTSLRSAV